MNVTAFFMRASPENSFRIRPIVSPMLPQSFGMLII
nr:MAG TPA_asm: hypothetical protein [Caudoviricetes sp.]